MGRISGSTTCEVSGAGAGAVRYRGPREGGGFGGEFVAGDGADGSEGAERGIGRCVAVVVGDCADEECRVVIIGGGRVSDGPNI